MTRLPEAFYLQRVGGAALRPLVFAVLLIMRIGRPWTWTDSTAACRSGLDAVDEQLIGRPAGRAREDGLALTGEGGLLAQLTKRLVESLALSEIVSREPAARWPGAWSSSGSPPSTAWCSCRSPIWSPVVGGVEPQVRRAATSRLPTEHGLFDVVGFEGVLDRAEHLALVTGTITDGRPVPVHVHTERLVGDVTSSTACRCRHGLDEAMVGFLRTGPRRGEWWSISAP